MSSKVTEILVLREGMGNLITLKQAADLLCCTTQHVYVFVRQGLLRPQYPEGKSLTEGQHFFEEEVSALVEAKAMGSDMPTVAAMARQAFVSSRMLERTVEQLLEVLGAKIPRLPPDKDSVLALYIQAEDALHSSELPSAKEVLDWARVFYGLHEDYLALVTVYVGTDEPWRIFMDLAQKLYNEAPVGTADKELEAAYGYLAVSVRNARNVAYFYVRHRLGRIVASDVFPNTTGDVHEEIIALAFPD
jgi:hypothetical protein